MNVQQEMRCLTPAVAQDRDRLVLLLQVLGELDDLREAVLEFGTGCQLQLGLSKLEVATHVPEKNVFSVSLSPSFSGGKGFPLNRSGM